jgi:cyclase
MVTSWRTGTTELARGVFAYVQEGGGLCVANAGILSASEGATVIDALFTPSMTRALIDEARRVGSGAAAGARISRLIDTHHHIDHTLGNAGFPPETEVLAHARAKAEMERSGLAVLPLIARLAPHFAPELEGAVQRLPDRTFDGDLLELEIAGRQVRLLHPGIAHTRGDVLVHLPQERILFAGDVAFFSVTPLGHEGHLGRWLKVIDRIDAMDDVDTIVPGHGPVGGKQDLRVLRGYLQLVHDAARRAFDAGVPEKEATDSIDLGEYAGWAEANRLGPNVERVYAELRAEISD